MSIPFPAEVTLSIVSHGHGPLLENLLRDLAAMPELRNVRLLLTLNLEQEPFDASAHPALSIDVLRNERPRGFGANHNAALMRCKSPWFAVMNPDLRLSENPFPALLDAATRHGDAALLAPLMIGPGGELEDAVRENLTLGSLFARRLLGRRGPLSVNAPARRNERFHWFAGMFMLLRTDRMRAVGGFDERFFMYCEDYDLCARLWSAGHALVLVPEARAVHAAQRDSHRSLRALGWHLSSLLRVWTSRAFWSVTLGGGRR